ncbi:hypothetical protein VNO77_06729 [Canavalia gladiata]|uniref:Uncharacterized protein n=1 Tax=Canavalia gladiata TaxID=3824 RepID=A0AAN9M7Q7_CANGL
MDYHLVMLPMRSLSGSCTFGQGKSLVKTQQHNMWPKILWKPEMFRDQIYHHEGREIVIKMVREKDFTPLERLVMQSIRIRYPKMDIEL